MEPNQMLKSRIESLIESDRIVLFMKGTRMQPMCGFSAATIGILDSLTPEYTTVQRPRRPGDPGRHQGFSEWPTIPQLYIDKEFVGGCDIVKQMFNNGELHEMLGADAPDGPRPRSPSAPPPPRSSPTRSTPIRATPYIFPSTGAGSTRSTLDRWKGTRSGRSRTGSRCCSTWRRRRRRKGCRSTVEETVQGTAFKIDQSQCTVSGGPDVAVRARGCAARSGLCPDARGRTDFRRAGAGAHRGLDSARRRRLEDRVWASEG